jgi:hypothetical protein
MVCMINSETYGGWNSLPKVAYNSENFVDQRVFMSYQMGEVMDENVACMSDCGAEYVDDDEDDGP